MEFGRVCYGIRAKSKVIIALSSSSFVSSGEREVDSPESPTSLNEKYCLRTRLIEGSLKSPNSTIFATVV